MTSASDNAHELGDKQVMAGAITFNRVIAIVITGLIGWSATSIQSNSVELRETRVSLTSLTEKVKDFQSSFERRVDGFASKEDMIQLRAQVTGMETRLRDAEQAIVKNNK